MAQVTRIGIAATTFALLLTTTIVLAETVTATCYSPTGKQFHYEGGKGQESDDGFSNSNPTFFFSTKDPEVLIESWQAALPFPDLITRERVDDIVPPSVTRSAILFRSSSVIHALSKQGRDTWSTTLYLDDDIAIFTRIRLENNGLSSGPMGAIYTAKCNFTILE